MGNSLRRISAIARADLAYRFRRPAAMVTALVVAASVYLIVPAVETGRTLLQINGSRVIYSSASVALGTAAFCSLLLSVIGYYLVGNSLRRDLQSRTAGVIAASPVTSLEFLMGRSIGSFLYLAGVMIACMLSAMVMFMIRGEGPLQPYVFLTIYCWLALPAIAFAATVALAFESIPLLSGRFGDIAFFFFWALIVGMVAAIAEQKAETSLLSSLDIVGFSAMLRELREQFHTTSMSIGSSSFNASRTPIHFEGIRWTWPMVALRLSNFILPFLMLTVARIGFHRFDPVRTKSISRHARQSILSRVNRMMKPLSRLSGWISPTPSSMQFGKKVRADIAVTFSLSPLLLPAMLLVAILSLVLPMESVQQGLLPVIALLLVAALSGLVSRDQQARAEKLLWTFPSLQSNYTGWKMSHAILLAFGFTIIPILWMMAAGKSQVLTLVVGTFFLAAMAVGLEALSRSQKPFIGISLMLLYISLNAATDPAFDFMGFNGSATFSVQVAYFAIGLVVLGGGAMRHHFLHARQ